MLEKLIRLETNDPEDLNTVVQLIFNVCVFLFIIGSTVIMGHWIITTQPPEPQWWLEFEKMIGVTW